MPVYLSGNSIVLHFGYGDIAPTVGFDKESGTIRHIAFKVGPPGKIGEFEGNRDDADEFSDPLNRDIPVCMTFDKIESINVVMNVLHDLRAAMVEQQDKAAAE